MSPDRGSRPRPSGMPAAVLSYWPVRYHVWFLQLAFAVLVLQTWVAAGVGGPPAKPLPLAPVARLPEQLRGAPKKEVQYWFPELRDPPTAMPPRPDPGPRLPPPPKACVVAGPYYLGEIYAAQDVRGEWHPVRLIEGPNACGTFKADVIANMSTYLKPYIVVEQWREVYGTPEFLRSLPPTPSSQLGASPSPAGAPAPAAPEAPPAATPVFVRDPLRPGNWIKQPKKNLGPEVEAASRAAGVPEYLLSPGPWPLIWEELAPDERAMFANRFGAGRYDGGNAQ